MRLFIDTDIGDDIDDALAIAMAVESGADIVGVTTVYRDARVRATIVKKLLALSGRSDVHVVAGASEPVKAPYYIGKLTGRKKSPCPRAAARKRRGLWRTAQSGSAAS